MNVCLRVSGTTTCVLNVWKGAREDWKLYIPPRCVEYESIDRLPESRRVEEGEQDEASANEGEAGGNTLCGLEVTKFFET